MKMIKEIVISLIMVVVTSSCNRNANADSLTKRGFIIFDNANHWHFVPVESMNSTDCYQDIETSKLGKGFQFPPSKVPNLSYVQRTLDTLANHEGGSRFLKITPVEIQFSFEQKYLDLYESNSLDSKWNFKYKDSVEGKSIEFTYNIFPVRIQKVKPLFCLTKAEKDIRECNCEHKNDDVNDYLFKVCDYLTKIDPYSPSACRYEIREISTDTLDGKVVTKVELSCCYLGDVAYFDINTKDLISISYGAK